MGQCLEESCRVCDFITPMVAGTLEGHNRNVFQRGLDFLL